MKRILAKSILALAAGASLFALPTTANADDFRFRVGYHDRGGGGDWRRANYEPRRVWVEPVYEERCSQVWVEPVYRTESVPVFVNEYTENKCDRVWVEPVYEVREVVRRDRRGCRIVTRERVCVREGGWRTVERPVVVPAHYRHEDRQVLVTAGHYETRRDRVCVREGYWQTAAPERPRFEREGVAVDFRVGGRF